MVFGFGLGRGGAREGQKDQAARQDCEARQKPGPEVFRIEIGGNSHVRDSVHGQLSRIEDLFGNGPGRSMLDEAQAGHEARFVLG